MHVLVLGAKGQLGRELMRVFSENGEVYGADLPALDIADQDAVSRLVDQVSPEWIINAAAYTDVEKAEKDPETAFRVNQHGAAAVAEAAASSGASLVYYSTDFVFDGLKSTPYEPGDPISPRGVYAESKALGEAATFKAHPSGSAIIRTAWLYGPGGNNFVEKILRAALTRPVLRVVQDESGSPTHTEDLALATRALCQASGRGLFHATNTGVCTRHAFAEAIVRAAGLTVQVEPCLAAEYPSAAPRPAYSALSSLKLEAACGFHMRPWEEALERYMKRREALA